MEIVFIWSERVSVRGVVPGRRLEGAPRVAEDPPALSSFQLRPAVERSRSHSPWAPGGKARLSLVFGPQHRTRDSQLWCARPSTGLNTFKKKKKKGR